MKKKVPKYADSDTAQLIEPVPALVKNNPKSYFEFLSDSLNDKLGSIVSTEFPPNLYNPMRYVLSSRGKRFRPVLLIMACESLGGKLEDAYNAALAVEILHNFTLVHDDIMDNDDLRRGLETVHKKWNENIAILAGDGLIALAYRYLLKTRTRHIRTIIKIFSEAIINICEGQSLDKDMEQVANVSIDEYLYMIERKTGVLLAISTELGGMLGLGTKKQVATLRKFGLEMGVAFQIQDDLLDIVSDEIVLGKDLGSDLVQGKKTYPFILFVERAGKNDGEYVRRILQNRNACGRDIKKVQELLVEYDIVRDTINEVDRRLDAANSYLTELHGVFDSDRLLFLSDMIRYRKH